MASSISSTNELEPESKNFYLARFKPLFYTNNETTRAPLRIQLDPLCSRSSITSSTLATHFPNLLLKTYPSRREPRYLFKDDVVIKGYKSVTLPLEFWDLHAKIVKLDVDVEIRISEKILEGKIVLGMDFWGGGKVGVCWVRNNKEKELEGCDLGKEGPDEVDEGFLGLVVGEQRVKFEKSLPANNMN